MRKTRVALVAALAGLVLGALPVAAEARSFDLWIDSSQVRRGHSWGQITIHRNPGSEPSYFVNATGKIRDVRADGYGVRLEARRTTSIGTTRWVLARDPSASGGPRSFQWGALATSDFYVRLCRYKGSSFKCTGWR